MTLQESFEEIKDERIDRCKKHNVRTIRRSAYTPGDKTKKAHKACHVVSAWANSLGVCFGQVKTKKEGEYVISLKGNQGTIEKRACYVCTNIDWLAEKDAWKHLHAVGMLVSERIDKKTGNKSVERRYFLTSLTDAAQAAYAMRAHWSVENNLHWVLDTVFNEDYCLVRKDNAAANLNVLRKIALNTLKQVDFSDVVKAKQLPLCHKQRLCDKREDCLERIFNAL